MSTDIIRENEITPSRIEQIFIKAQAPFTRDADDDFVITTPKGNRVFLSVLTPNRMIRVQCGIVLPPSQSRNTMLEVVNRLNDDYVFATFFFGEHPEMLSAKYYLLCWDWITETQVIKCLMQLDAVVIQVKKELPDLLTSLASRATEAP